MKKKHKIALRIIVGFVAVCGIAAVICIYYFVGFPKTVGVAKYSYYTQVIWVEHDDIQLYGQALIPEGGGVFPTVIYAHGAESDYKADMTTLKSLAMSGIACYAFDFYGWTDRSVGPQGTNWFRNVSRGMDNTYENKVLQQVDDLNAVIEKVKTFDFVDADRLYLLGSSMGGSTVATAAVSHSEDIRGVILQYPAINLNPDAMIAGSELDANGYTGPVLILQGTKDKITPLSMAQELTEHYNTLYENHAELIIYDGQPHVFTGTQKVMAAEDIYRFLERNG